MKFHSGVEQNSDEWLRPFARDHIREESVIFAAEDRDLGMLWAGRYIVRPQSGERFAHVAKALRVESRARQSAKRP
jgi:hypothetical protein